MQQQSRPISDYMPPPPPPPFTDFLIWINLILFLRSDTRDIPVTSEDEVPQGKKVTRSGLTTNISYYLYHPQEIIYVWKSNCNLYSDSWEAIFAFTIKLIGENQLILDQNILPDNGLTSFLTKRDTLRKWIYENEKMMLAVSLSYSLKQKS